MPKYLIEREIPGAGQWSAEQRRKVAQKSNAALKDLGPDVQWVESFVTGDKVYCVYLAPSEEMIRAHGAKGGFPVTRVSQIGATIDPTTAEG
jgi:hypothetical protein